MQNLDLKIGAEIAARYHRDGVVQISSVLDGIEVDELKRGVEAAIKSPGPQSARHGGAAEGLVYDNFMWTRHIEFWRLQNSSPIPKIAADLMGSPTSTLMADVLFVKERGATARIPWHQDQAYLWYDGMAICTWLPLDEVTIATGAVEYALGSHRQIDRYGAVAFNNSNADSADTVKAPPSDAEIRELYEIVHFECSPGDLILHHPLTLHSSPGNSSNVHRRRAIAARYVGDGAKYAPKVDGARPVWDPELDVGAAFGEGLFPTVWPHVMELPQYWLHNS